MSRPAVRTLGAVLYPQFELLDSMKLPEEVQERIYRGNATRLLKLAKGK